MSAPFRMPFRVRAETADQATAIAKAQARASGWTVRTVATCRLQPNGEWIVELSVYAGPVPA